MSLGGELRKARQAAGLTQVRLAFSAGLDRAYINQLENDHKSPTVDVVGGGEPTPPNPNLPTDAFLALIRSRFSLSLLKGRIALVP